jgi:hypothetical protein
MDYFIIGDIHGHADALEALLSKAGFAEQNGVWRNPTVHAVFIGDLVDRGPKQLGVINVVRRMVNDGAASVCLGNHEFNAIGWSTEHSKRPGDYYRPRSTKNRSQHSVFLDAVTNDSDLHKELVAWFKKLPMWLEFPGFRAVHACWHAGAQRKLKPLLDSANALTEDGIHAVFRKGTDYYDAAEVILKGIEVPLPPGVSFRDKDNHERWNTRIKWWDEKAATYRKAALVDPLTAKRLPDDPLPQEARVQYDGAKPLFFGHYWMTGVPHLISPQKTCLDFSIANNGYLTGYRWSGEESLDSRNLLWIG